MTSARIRGLTPEAAVATPKRRTVAIGLPTYGGIEAGFMMSRGILAYAHERVLKGEA